MAVTFDNLVLIYNSDVIKEAPKSWFELADKKYAGKVAFNGMPDIQGLSLVLILDKARGGTNYLTNVDKGIAAIGEIAPNVLTWEPKPESVSGDHRRTGQSRRRAGTRARRSMPTSPNGKLKATLPAEGSVFQINTINLVANRPRQGRGREVRELCARHDGPEGVHRGNVLRAGQRQGADRGCRDRPHRGQEHGQGHGRSTGSRLAKVREQIMEQWRRKVLPLSR